MQEKMLQVKIDGKEVTYREGTRYLDAAKEFQKDEDSKIVLASVNGKLKELTKKIKDQDQIVFLTIKDKNGFMTYRRSMILLMLKAIYSVGGFELVDRVGIHYSVGNGFYVTVKGQKKVENSFLEQVEKTMHEMVEKKLPITKTSVSTDDAIDLFHRLGMEDKEKLFHYRIASKVNIYDLAGFKDYFYGYMVPDTGYLDRFVLIPYDEGFVLQMPNRIQPELVPEFRADAKLFQVQKESLKWGEMMNIRTVGDLNERIVSESVHDLMLVQEALQEKKISEIASMIAAQPEKKLIMIAGPSSSGKTTFSHRLSTQLSANGMKPHPIPMDNYFVEREDTPKDEDGNPDYECLEAIDIELFNRNMTDLLAGKAVDMPIFNFKTGKKEYKGNILQLGTDDVLVIEGIHGLDDRLSYTLPKESKFKIYISALTQLNIDEHNRIPTTDGRLLRRIVRDARTRGTLAKDTIAMWPSVRRGEEAHIFPYQEEADVMFNSALIYELAVLKVYAQPLLLGIQRNEPEYQEAKRLLKFLDYFVSIPSENIPLNSLLREFVGGSCYQV